MVSKIVEVTDDSTGVVLASFEADTEMGGVTMSFYGVWHTPGQWLRDNAGVE